MSEKRRSEQAEYNRRVRLFRIKHPFCAVCPMRGRRSLPTRDPHHPRGRAGNLRMAIHKCFPVCRDCHHYIDDHRKWAKALGLIEKWGVQWTPEELKQ